MSAFVFWVARTRPRVKIIVPESATLFDLHLAIHAAFPSVDDRPSDHLHRFIDRKRDSLYLDERFAESSREWDDYALTHEAPLPSLDLSVGDRLHYEWDMGVTWGVELIVRSMAAQG